MTNTADATAEEGTAPKKKSKGLLFGMIGALLFGGAAFYTVYAGIIDLPFGGTTEPAEAAAGDGGEAAAEPELFDRLPTEAAFVPLDDILIALGPESTSSHLKVALVIEVVPGQEAAVEAVKPRIVDVLNVFLRAVEVRDLESPRAMSRLRAQMLRRVQLVTPEGAVRDVLIQQFVLN